MEGIPIKQRWMVSKRGYLLAGLKVFLEKPGFRDAGIDEIPGKGFVGVEGAVGKEVRVDGGFLETAGPVSLVFVDPFKQGCDRSYPFGPS